MICSNCKKEIPEANYCKYCGTRLTFIEYFLFFIISDIPLILLYIAFNTHNAQYVGLLGYAGNIVSSSFTYILFRLLFDYLLYKKYHPNHHNFIDTFLPQNIGFVFAVGFLSFILGIFLLPFIMIGATVSRYIIGFKVLKERKSTLSKKNGKRF